MNNKESNKSAALFSPSYHSSFASRLRATLESLNYSQKQLSEAIGKTQQMVNHYCLGNNIPNITVLAAIAQELNVSTDYLLGLTDSESTNLEIRKISDSTGLSTKSIQALQKYKNIPIFIDVLNFLLSDLKLLEAIADFLTAPLLDAVKEEPYNNVNLSLPIFDKLSGLFALEMHDCAVAAQNRFSEMHTDNKALQEYVADRYIAKYSTDSRCNIIPTHHSHYSAYTLLSSLAEANHTNTEFDNFVESLEYFGISDVSYIKSIKATTLSKSDNSNNSLPQSEHK